MDALRLTEGDEDKRLRLSIMEELSWSLVRKSYRRADWYHRWKKYLRLLVAKNGLEVGREDFEVMVHKLTINAKDWCLRHIKEIEHMKYKSDELVYRRGEGVFNLLPLSGWGFIAEEQIAAFKYIEGSKYVEISAICSDGAVPVVLHQGAEEWTGTIGNDDIGVLCDCFLELCATADLLNDGQVVYVAWVKE